MVKGVLENFWKGAARSEATASINIIPGFDGFCVGNNRELKRLLDLMQVTYMETFVVAVRGPRSFKNCAGVRTASR